MTLLFFDGFQDGNLMPKPEWDGGSSGVAAGRDGSTNGSSQYGGAATKTLALPTSAATCIAGIAMKAENITSSGGQLPLNFMSSSTVIQLLIRLNSSGLIELRRTSGSGTLLGTSSGHTPVAANDWHYYEMKATLTTATTSTVTVRLDGITVLTVTGVATSSVIGNVTHVRINFNSATNSAYADDMYICDAVDGTATDGRPNNDFLGDIRVQSLFPTAAGDSTQWTPTTGANYDAVNETPPNTTDYVFDSVSGHQDLYQLSDLSGVVSAVYGVREHFYAAKSDAGSVNIKPVIKESGGTVTKDAGQAPATSFNIISGVIKKSKPSDSSVWTVTDINALQAGVEVA